MESAPLRGIETYGPRLALLIEIIAALESGEPWPDPALTGLELVDDLRENAERCAARGRFDDAAARLHRATHLLAQLRLRRLYRIPILGAAPASYGPAALEEADGLGLWVSYERLAALGDTLGRYFRDRHAELSRLLEKRRRSLFGQGLAPLDREAWSSMGPQWHAWLDGAQEIL